MIPMLERLLYREKGEESCCNAASCVDLDKRTWSSVFRIGTNPVIPLDIRLALLVGMFFSTGIFFFLL